MTVEGDLYQFGPFRLDPEAGILYRGAEPTMLGQRAVALLRRLLESAGVPVSKDALVEAGWGRLAVADNNLTVQIAALRRVLAEADAGSWIETLPRRGYRYVGPAVVTNAPDVSAAARAASAPALPDRPSVAVLPFSNLSGDPEQEYFADGMVDDIITGLARINWLFVIARNSTFTYKGRAVDVKQVGRELGVRYVLEGSVRKAGGSVRVTGQMIDASTGAHVWAERYDRSSDNIFAIQDEIALSAVGAIAPSVRKAEIERVRRKRPDSLDAYDLVLRAQPDVDSGMPEQVTRALALLERAIALEPAYALAHGNAAMCHHCLFLRAGLQEVNRAASIRHARSAIVHGQDDALALTCSTCRRARQTITTSVRILQLSKHTLIGRSVTGETRAGARHADIDRSVHFRTLAVRFTAGSAAAAMKDMPGRPEKLRADAAECALIRDFATDKETRGFHEAGDHLTVLASEVETRNRGQCEAHLMKAGWGRPFEDPIEVDGRELVTLLDAGEYIEALLKKEHSAPWQAAMQALDGMSV